MKNIFTFILILCLSSPARTQNKDGKISENYSLAEFIVDSFNYEKIRYNECKWEVCFSFFSITKKGRISMILFSDSVSSELRQELITVIKKSNGRWDHQYAKKLSKAKYIVQPVLRSFIENCQNKILKESKYLENDSILEKEVDLWKRASVISTQYLENMRKSWITLVPRASEGQNYISKAILLSSCVLRDTDVKTYRRL
jgi:hypothetical protein